MHLRTMLNLRLSAVRKIYFTHSPTPYIGIILQVYQSGIFFVKQKGP